MVALVASLAAALALGASDLAPRRPAHRHRARPRRPGLLTVHPDARGIATLGRGYTVAAYQSGFRVSASTGPLVDTIPGVRR